MYYKNGKWYVYGIGSYISGNSNKTYCDNSKPSYFTKVGLFLSFIKNSVTQATVTTSQPTNPIIK